MRPRPARPPRRRSRSRPTSSTTPTPELASIPLAKDAGLPGLGGAKFELTFIDHQGNPSVAQQQALRLINQDKVHLLFGAYQSSCTFTATPVAERYGIPFMVGDSAALNITGRGFKWVFRVTPIADRLCRRPTCASSTT